MVKSRSRVVHDPRMMSRLQTNINCQFTFGGTHYNAIIVDLSLKGAFLSSSLFMSGYTADIITSHDVLGDDLPFIQKPFTSQILATKIREVLDQV